MYFGEEKYISDFCCLKCFGMFARSSNSVFLLQLAFQSVVVQKFHFSNVCGQVSCESMWLLPAALCCVEFNTWNIIALKQSGYDILFFWYTNVLLVGLLLLSQAGVGAYLTSCSTKLLHRPLSWKMTATKTTEKMKKYVNWRIEGWICEKLIDNLF